MAVLTVASAPMAFAMIWAMTLPWIASDGGVRNTSPSSSSEVRSGPVADGVTIGIPAGMVTFSAVGMRSGVPQGPAMALTPSLSISLVAAS